MKPHHRGQILFDAGAPGQMEWTWFRRRHWETNFVLHFSPEDLVGRQLFALASASRCQKSPPTRIQTSLFLGMYPNWEHSLNSQSLALFGL
jgi:hypothetical protein